MKLILNGLLAFILCLSFVSCNEKKTDAVTGTGTLRIVATDAPFDFDVVASAKLTVTEILVRPESGEKITVMDTPVTMDLLQLRNGLVETLADVEVPAGKYNEILLKISNASVELKDGRHFNLTVPSGASSGLKIFVSPSVTVTTGVSSDLLLDFDLSRSFVATGTSSNITGFNFRPVLRAVAMAATGTISGQVLNVTDDQAVPGATVTVKENDSVITTAVADSEGYFKIIGLPSGNYNVTAEAQSFGSITIDSVPVTDGNEVTTHFILTPVTTTP